MRSEALGFNAPIVVEGGVYSYSDSNYAIFNSKMEELEIMKEVLYLLIEEKDKIHNVKLKKVMVALSQLTGIELEEEEPISMNIKFSNNLEISKRNISNNKITLDSSFEEDVYSNLMPDLEQPKYNWKSIFELI